MKKLLLLLISIHIFTLTSCGQKGELYLPLPTIDNIGSESVISISKSKLIDLNS